MDLTNISTEKLVEELYQREGVRQSRIDTVDNTQLLEISWDKI